MQQFAGRPLAHKGNRAKLMGISAMMRHSVLIPSPKVESLSHFEDVDLVILGEEYGDLIEEISGQICL